jgi:hypothetical protein
MALRKPFHYALLASLLTAGGLGLWVTPSGDTALGVVLTSGANAPGQGNASDVLAPPITSVAITEQLLAGDEYKSKVGVIRARHTGSQPLFRDDQAYAEARAQQVLFAEGVSAQAAAQSPLANERRLQDDRLWITYDMRVLAARAEGDQFVLPMPGAAAVDAEIDTVKLIQGQYLWSGRLLGPLGGTFHITQVFDDHYAVGHITTPTGEYLLEAKGGTGWMVESHKEFVLPPDGNDTMHQDDSSNGHKH